MITYSLYVTFFTAMGRLFDRDSRSFTVHRFLAECKSRIGEFSKRELERRRLNDVRGKRPDYLDEYLQQAYEATNDDLERLESAAERAAETYRAKYELIRHKIIAHKDFATIGSADSLYAKTDIEEFRGLLEFLHQVEVVIRQLHDNATLTALTDHTLEEEEKRWRHDIESLLEKLLRRRLPSSRFDQE